jgi:hypothetical protein
MIALLGNNVVAKIDAFVADIYGWSSNQLSNLILALSAERANEIPGPIIPVLWHRTPAFFNSLFQTAFRSSRDHLVNQTILLRLFAGHKHVPVGVLLNLL